MALDRSATTARARVTRSAIAREALTLIRMDGVGAVTMRAVAERLSIQAPSLYEHIRGKDELLDLVVQESFEDFADNTREYDDVQTLDGWLDLVVTGSLQLRGFYLRHPGLAGLMLQKLDPKRTRFEGSRAALVRAQLDALTRIGFDAREVRPLFDATVMWSLSAIAGEQTIAVDVSARQREERYRRGLDLIMNGLRTALVRSVGEYR